MVGTDPRAVVLNPDPGLAVGAQPRDIQLQFLIEALILTLAGAFAGLAVGFYPARKASQLDPIAALRAR